MTKGALVEARRTLFFKKSFLLKPGILLLSKPGMLLLPKPGVLLLSKLGILLSKPAIAYSYANPSCRVRSKRSSDGTDKA